VQGRAFELAKGDRFALPTFRSRLVEAGYASVGQVTSPGEFAVRGSLLDVFPMGAAAPLRIDLFDDVIEGIRRFDPDTQRSLDSLERVRMLPAREMPLDADGVRVFRGRFRARFEGEPTQAGIYRGVSEGLAPAGIEFYLPLFFEHTATLFDYLPKNAILVHDAALTGALERNWQDIHALRGTPPRHRAPGARPARDLPRPGANASAACELRRDRAQQFKADLESTPPQSACIIFPPPRRASCASTRTRKSHSRRSKTSACSLAGASCSRPTQPGAAKCCMKCCAATTTALRRSRLGGVRDRRRGARSHGRSRP